ncbi:MAG: hypothetical protein WAS36_02950 [Candidatus Saccharimonadales bacterium]
MAKNMTGKNVESDAERDKEHLRQSRQLVAQYLETLALCRDSLIERYGEPDDESVWPILFTQDSEDVRPAEHGDTLVWLTGDRVVAEEYYPARHGEPTEEPTVGPTSLRRVVDVDVISGDMVSGGAEGDSEMVLWPQNVKKNVSPVTNVPAVYAAQIANRINSSQYVDIDTEFSLG